MTSRERAEHFLVAVQGYVPDEIQDEIEILEHAFDTHAAETVQITEVCCNDWQQGRGHGSLCLVGTLVAEEREACAKIADFYQKAEQEPEHKVIPREIATAIRART